MIYCLRGDNMKRAICLFLLTLCLAFSFLGCNNDSDIITATIDVASSVNFRCDVYVSVSDEGFTLGQDDASYLFEACFENKDKGTKLKGDKVAVATDYIKIYFVGDSVDNAPIKNDKADYGGFVIFSNNVVRFEYDTASEYYQFENGFYNFINTYMMIFADR